MLSNFNKKDIDIIMKIWKDNNQKYQSFMGNQYWIDKYIQTRDEFLNSKIYVYTESTKILAFVVFDDDGSVLNIQVKPEIQREGIGKLLLEKIKNENSNLCVKVFEKNVNAILFFKAMGFRKTDENVDDITNENVYNMKWNQNNNTNATFIYFDNSISDDLIDKYDKISNVQFYNIHVCTKEDSNIFNIDISNGLERKNGNIYITDYIEIRNKLNSIMKNDSIIIYFDCNNDYSYLYSIIKDIIKVKSNKLTIVLHKPFSVEGSKKMKMYEDVKESFNEYNVTDVDYEEIGKDAEVTFRDAFDMRDEELLKMVCNIK